MESLSAESAIGPTVGRVRLQWSAQGHGRPNPVGQTLPARLDQITRLTDGLSHAQRSKASTGASSPEIGGIAVCSSTATANSVSAPKSSLPQRLHEVGLSEAKLVPWLQELQECLQKLRETSAPTAGFIEESLRQRGRERDF